MADVELIKAKALQVPKRTAIGTSFAGTAAAVLAFYESVEKNDASEPVIIGLVVAAAIAFIGTSIAAGADALARGYASAHATPVGEGESSNTVPIWEPALERLATKASPTVTSSATEVIEAYKSVHGSSAPASGEEAWQVVPLPLGLRARDPGGDTVVLIALRERADQREYLTARTNATPTWLGEEALALLDQEFVVRTTS